MKIGAENRKELIAMVVLVLIAIPMGIYSCGRLREANAPSSTVAASAAPNAGATAPRKTAPAVPLNDLDPTLRLDLLRTSRKIDYKGGSRNIFRMEAPHIPPPIQSVRANVPPPPPVNPAPPPAPPINLKFYGFASKAGQPKQIFLSQGEEPAKDVFIAREGDIVNRRYKIIEIRNNSIVVEDVLNNNRQTIPLTAS